MKDELIFEILSAPQHIKIYRSGRVEGVNKGAIIANWLFCRDAQEKAKKRGNEQEKRHRLGSY